MGRAFRFNKYSFHQWLVVGVLVGSLMLTWSGIIQANGGTILLVEQVGAYDFTITGSPYPLQVGQNDISILLGRLADAQVVLDAQVTLIAHPLDPPGEPHTFTATHDNAINKLYYAANVVFPTPGRWKLTVQVDGPEGSASADFETEVVQGSLFGSRTSVELIGAAIIVGILGLIFFVLNRRSEEKSKADLEGAENDDFSG
jgi:hypothetical protein